MKGASSAQVLRHGVFAVAVGVVGAAASVVLCLVVGWAYDLVCAHGWLLYLLPIFAVASLLLYRALRLPLDTTTHTVINDICADRPISPALAPGILLGTALSILGAFTFEALGQGGNVVTVVMFILYMGAVILFLAWGGAEDRASTTQARDFFEAFIQSRCNKLAAAHGLTPRETELLALLGRGHGYAYIAESLYISETTVRTHARNIYHKLGIASQEELLSLIDHTELGEEH